MRSKNRRSLTIQPLETRQLMAADTLHNFLQPLDVTNDAQVSAMDALAVINRIQREGVEVANTSPDRKFFDVNDDSQVTPLDALRIINWLNRDESTFDVRGQIDSSEGRRVGIELRSDRSGVKLEVRLQNATPRDTYPVYLEETWIGTITADERGRGKLELHPDFGIEGTVPTALLIGRNIARVKVDNVAEVDLDVERLEINGNPGSDPNSGSASEPHFLMTEISSDGNRVGRAVYVQHDEQQHLGIYARGLTENQEVNVSVGDALLGSFTANSYGVLLVRVNPTEYPELPRIESGTIISVEGVGTGTFTSFPSNPHHNQYSAYAAIFAEAPTYIGAAGLLLSENRTRITMALSRVQPNTSYIVSIDSVPVFEVTSDRRGRIEYLFDSRRAGNNGLINPVPPISEDSVIQVGDLVSASIYSAPTNR